MNYKVIDKETYYRKGVFRHFSEDCKCSVSMTARVDVTELAAYSRRTGTRFYINFLYILSKVLNSREDYRMGYLWQTDELICYDVINPTQYVFHEDTETCTPVYTEYDEDYESFYAAALRDVEDAKKTREYGLDTENHPNWFEASYIPWLSYDSLHLELPDGYLYFAPIINWGKYREENGRLVMPVTVRLNHAIADGYLVANVFRLLGREIRRFVGTACESAALKLSAVHHIAIIVSDYEAARAFYVDKLGFAVLRENYRPEKKDWKLDLRLNDETELEIFAPENPPKRPSYPEACGLRHLAFRVENIEDTVAALEALGVACEPILTDSFTGRKMTFFHDPDGLPLEVHE